DLEFSPDFNSVFGLTYRAKHQLTFDYTSRLVGRMKLPEYPDRSNYSPLFSEHNLKVTKVFQNNFEVFISGKNLLNYIQKDAIIAANAPFSEDFATDYVYGPLQGRRFVLGMKISFE
ncbi:MAG: TonB-dependent receptor, partial [Balneolales bacterium]|nr:TonB-dependent receptor [Balneolales bacterium]